MRTLFPARSLALHERLNDASLPDLCQVEIPIGASDGEGGRVVRWVPTGAPLSCRVSPAGTATERVLAEQVTTLARYLVVFGRGVEVPLGARLRAWVGGAELLLAPHGSNAPRSFEAQRKHECSLWRGQ